MELPEKTNFSMRITLAQLNPIVGDIEGNLERATTICRQYHHNTDLIAFPELFITGYPPRDLLDRPAFISEAKKAIDRLVEFSKSINGTGILVGSPWPSGRTYDRRNFNCALLIADGTIIHAQAKSLLPTYDVFDETRYFDVADSIEPVSFAGELLGITICEDAWNNPTLWPQRSYSIDPVKILAEKKASIMINISASPFYMGKEMIRYKLLSEHAQKYGLPFYFVNQVGANDELIFDGRSLVIDNRGTPVKVFDSFKEMIQTIDTSARGIGQYQPNDDLASVHDALVLGIKDYMSKTGFKKAVLGLSGGIDSAVTCVLACRAIGKENVLGVAMPGPFSSPGSLTDARQLAGNLGIKLIEIPISDIYRSYLAALKAEFAGREEDITEENIQARIRGNILMAISNKFGHLVLSTGNKSELAVGYCTLYGDMAGGLAAIADVPKTMVYKLANYINSNGELIPLSSITKAPSAELRANQTDQDTLPPYDMLDEILEFYLEDGLSAREIISRGYEPEIVSWVIKAVNSNEYKRRQAAVTLKVTSKAFGVGRRMPIAARYGKW